MRTMLLGLAASLTAIAVPVSPATAQSFTADTASRFVADRGDLRPFRDIRRDGRRDHRDDRRDHRRHHDRFDDTVVIGGLGWSEGWALYNNRTFEPDSYNDWWHDRPDRAYPRWLQGNQNCAPERMWWSGGGWRC